MVDLHFPDRQSRIHRLPKGFDLTAIKQQSAAVPLGFAQRLQGDTDVASLSQCAGRLRFCPNTLLV